MSDCDKCSIAMNDALHDLEKTEDRYHETYLQLLKERSKWRELKEFVVAQYVQLRYEKCDKSAGVLNWVAEKMEELENKK